MDYQPNHAPDYGGVEKKVLPQNEHFIDSDPTRIYIYTTRDATQAEKIFGVYLRRYGPESRRHVLVKGNRLYLSTEAFSRLEKCARIANVPIRVKKADFIRRNGR